MTPTAPQRTGAPPSAPAPASENGHLTPEGSSPIGVSTAGARRDAQARRRRRRLLFGGVALLLIVAAGGVAVARLTPPSPAPPAPAAPALTAHGVVQPVARASIATMSGGVVGQLPVHIGEIVEPQHLVAQVNLPGQAEMVVAPWRGTVTGVNVHLGDTVLPGTVLMTIGDLSAYQVETTDVDEYVIGHLRPGQRVSMTVEALDQVTVGGFVRNVSLQQQRAGGGDHYPIVIDLASPNPSLRPGMTVRVTFLEGTD